MATTGWTPTASRRPGCRPSSRSHRETGTGSWRISLTSGATRLPKPNCRSAFEAVGRSAVSRRALRTTPGTGRALACVRAGPRSPSRGRLAPQRGPGRPERSHRRHRRSSGTVCPLRSLSATSTLRCSPEARLCRPARTSRPRRIRWDARGATVSAPLPVVSGAPLASHQRGVLARWSSPAKRASSRTHSMTIPTEQWIRGRERRTPKAPLVLVVKRSCRRPGCGPSRRAISPPWSGITQSPRVVPAISFRHGPPYLAHCLRRDRPVPRRSTRPPRHLLSRLQRLI